MVHRIFLFTSALGKKAEFKGERKPLHKNSLSIYFDGSDYYGVKNTEYLFGNPRYPYKSKFCPDTSFMLGNYYEHASKCPLLCTACFRHGYDFPCIEEEKIRCEKCNRDFMNEECYNVHLKTKKSHALCSFLKCCANCGEIYVLKNNFIHRCGEYKCSSCRKYHKRSESCVNFI